ncbi:uncharacterized protein G2W53_042336 [Senna tora]|uniref:Uncharacterized protein n=1 Tax=Senna tora TaxID=362788 RepID=A0A834VZU7_9FABA|nr:uncharacterized protein G2W53_042336 [Senna tora]
MTRTKRRSSGGAEKTRVLPFLRGSGFWDLTR